MVYQLGLIGYPIKHSLSPWIHKQFLEEANIQGNYSIFEVREDDLTELVQTIKEKRITGFNVTLPYKQKIIPLLDELDPSAKHIGAVNTVLNKDGRLIGYNTDGIGYLRSLEQSYPDLSNNKQVNILIIGAGGAARGIYNALHQAGYSSITIANRTIEKAKEIAQHSKSAITLDQAEENIATFDLIIQTTNVGMKPNQADSPIRIDGMKSSTIVSDIIYQPILTTLLREAKKKGAQIHQGHSMLLYQAQYAFEIWFGITPSLGNMNSQLKRILEG
ncbi:shikimate dehydrogenase [Ornithinibacillus sp. FSL M8-0202]|uniref:shikimate dehydrogenase n=1 Tax=Ornithinibacillus sp. FSL M8-0202 TaxID=2921616 RepID=UPI0030D35F71